jgi:hypothetical protein
MPAVIEAAPVPGRPPAEPWLARDRLGAACPLLDSGGEPWPLLARSGGDPIRIFGEWNGQGLRPISMLADGSGLPLSASVLGKAA